MIVAFAGNAAGGGSSLPTTNLTAHFDFSDLATLYKTCTPGNNPAYSSAASADGDAIAIIQSTHPVTPSDITAHPAGNSSPTFPTLKQTTPLLGTRCLDFDGGDFLRIMNRTADSDFSTAITASAGTMIVAFRILAFPSAGNADVIFASKDNGAYFGIYAANQSGTHVSCLNFDGSYLSNNHAAAIDENHVVMWRHESGVLYSSIDGGSESSVASGNTSPVTAIGIGGCDGSTRPFDGRIGEVAVWDIALTGADLTNAIAYFTDKWLP